MHACTILHVHTHTLYTGTKHTQYTVQSIYNFTCVTFLCGTMHCSTCVKQIPHMAEAEHTHGTKKLCMGVQKATLQRMLRPHVDYYSTHVSVSNC